MFGALGTGCCVGWVLGALVVILGCWYPNSGFEELAEGRNALSSPCGAA